MPMTESPAAAAASLNMAPPEVESTAATAEIDRVVVHDGAIDREYIAGVEAEARGGEVTRESSERRWRITPPHNLNLLTETWSMR